MHINEKNRTPKLVEADEGPSKSELKRQMTERQKLAEVLAALSSDALKTIPLDEAIKVAIAETNQIKSFEAIRRHKQYLGKLMRFLDEEELDAIQKRLDAIQGVSKAETAKLHFLESYRDRLIANDEAFTKMIEQYPDMDIQNMRMLIRNARREKEQNKPPKAYREIFRVLKDMGLWELTYQDSGFTSLEFGIFSGNWDAAIWTALRVFCQSACLTRSPEICR